MSDAAFEQADAEIHPFLPEALDIATCRTGAMFFSDLVAAFTNIRHALVQAEQIPPYPRVSITSLTRSRMMNTPWCVFL